MEYQIRIRPRRSYADFRHQVPKAIQADRAHLVIVATTQRNKSEDNMKLNRLNKSDLAIIAEAEAMNAELNALYVTQPSNDGEIVELNMAMANITGGTDVVDITDEAPVGETFDAVLEHQDPQTDPLLEETDPLLEEVVADLIEREEAEIMTETTPFDGAPLLDPETNVPGLSFDEVLGTFTDAEKQSAVVAMASAVDERMAFERANGNENIQRTLKSARNAFTLPSAGAVLLACGVDEKFVNRSMHDGKRYNVYAMGKLADAINALNGGLITNKINFAIMRTLFAARKAGVPFTGEVAKMACSDKIRGADAAVKAILIRHTVSASTAPTQASSTMQAMETLGLVKREGSHKNPTFTLTDHPAVAKLEEALAKAA